MSNERRIEIACFIAALILGACFLKGWVLEREARVKAETTARQQEAIIAKQNEEVEIRDKQADAYTQLLKDEADALRTPQQAAQVIVKYLPAPVSGQPAQAVATVTKDAFTAAEQAKLPDSPSYDVLTSDQAIAVAKNDLACDATTKQLATCRADTASYKTELAARAKESAAWQAAAKGGTKFQRLLQIVKYASCGAGGAFVGHLADKSHPAEGSAIGGAAGVTACSFF